MYAIKLELKLNNAERTLMAQHAGFSRFVYNYGLALYKQVLDIKGGLTKKISAIRKVLTNFTKKKPEFTSMFGTVVELVDRWFPSSKMCSECGHIQPMRLSDRVFHCQECGSVKCRDFNAALNLEHAPLLKVRRASPELNDCGQEAADSPGRSSK